MPNEKIYVGRARYVDTKYGEICKIWLTPEGVEAINRNVDNNGGINLNMSEMRQADRAGFTHTLIVDDWKPGQSSTRRHGPQRRESDGDQRRYAGRDMGQGENRAPSRRDDGGFGSYADQGQGNSGHRYSKEDCIPPEDPRWDNVSPEPFPEKNIEHSPQTDPDDLSGIDDEIPF